MRTSRTFDVLIGVALSVTPIFSSVSAQQQGSQATLLLEVDALRTEIAELRDMVERQQYQMRKLQRKLESQSNSTGFNGSGYSARPEDTQQYPSAQGNYSSSSAPNYQSETYPGSDVQQAQENNAGFINPNSSVSVNQGLPPYANQLPSESDYPESPISNSGEYQPGYGNTPTTQDPVGGQVSVEERVISASGLPTTAANSNFPPVVDRSVGTQGMQDATTIVLPPAYQAGDQVAYRRNPIDGSQIPVDMESSTASTSDARANNPMGAVVLAPTVGSQAGGVIAIPDGSANRIQNNVIRNRSGDASYSSQAPVASMSEQEFYQQGFGLLKESKHSEAINIFKQQISNYPSGNYADDAHYWIAESMYVNRSLDESKQYFRAIIDNYSQSSRLPDAMLKTAYIEQEQGNVIEARILLQEIVQYHPRSNAAISAKNRLAEL